jgi:hypothetical protein
MIKEPQIERLNAASHVMFPINPEDDAPRLAADYANHP